MHFQITLCRIVPVFQGMLSVLLLTGTKSQNSKFLAKVSIFSFGIIQILFSIYDPPKQNILVRQAAEIIIH